MYIQQQMNNLSKNILKQLQNIKYGNQLPVIFFNKKPKKHLYSFFSNLQLFPNFYQELNLWLYDINIYFYLLARNLKINLLSRLTLQLYFNLILNLVIGYFCQIHLLVNRSLYQLFFNLHLISRHNLVIFAIKYFYLDYPHY